MSKDLNRWQGIGRLGKDPEMRYLPNGDAVCNFSIATSETWKDKQTGERKESTEWVNLVAFRQLAEICGQYLKKGSKVYAEGKLTTRKWQDKEGNDRYTTEIRLDQLQMLDGKSEQPVQARSSQARGSNPAPAEQTAPFQDDDIPF